MVFSVRMMPRAWIEFFQRFIAETRLYALIEWKSVVG